MLLKRPSASIHRGWYLGLALTLAGAFPALTGHAEIPNDLEPPFSEAVLSLNAGDPVKTIQMLDALLARDKSVGEFYELKALAFRRAGKDGDAMRVYSELIQLRRKQNRPAAEIAPSAFELGVLLCKAGRAQQSDDYLAYALRAGFNPGASHLYMGLNALKSGAWQKAEESLNAAIATHTDDIVPTAYLYLGQVFLKTEYASGATQAFLSARERSQAILNSEEASPESKKLAAETLALANQALAPYGSPQFFGSVSTLTSYDSNALTVPSSVASSSQAGGKGTMGQSLAVGLGYLTSSLDIVQFVPSYRGGINHNFNSATRSAQFATNTLSLYVTVQPLAATTWGLRTEGSYFFRDEVDASTDKGTFKKFSSTLTLAPFFRTEVARKMNLGGELSYDSNKYFQDEFSSDDQKRSGGVLSGMLYWQYERGARFFNPYVAIKAISDGAKGAEYKSTSEKISISNSMHLNSRLDLQPSVSYGPTSYSKRPSGARKDKYFEFDLPATYHWKERWTLIGSVGITHNGSTVPASYEYNRFVLSAGASYSLF